MKILVTGDAGFIGSHLCKHLLSLGHEVVGVDNMGGGELTELYWLKWNRILSTKSMTGKYAHITGDLKDLSFINDIFNNQQFDIVYHLAGQAGIAKSLIDPSIYVNDNVLVMFNILEACKQNNIKHLLFSSSSSVYSKYYYNGGLPSTEDDDDTDHPKSFYAATKKAAEIIAFPYSNYFRITALRLFTVYGPWGRPDMSYWKFADAIVNDRPLSIYRSMHGDEVSRDFMYVEDTVKMISELMKPDGYDYEVFNIGGENPTSVDRFIDVLEEALGKKAIREYKELPSNEVVSTNANMHRYRSMVPDIQKMTPLSEGLKYFADWFKTYHKKPFTF